MSRRTVAIAFGVVCLPACGDGTHALTDASTAPLDSRPNADAPQRDAPGLDAFVDTSLILRYDFEDSSTVVKDSSFRGKDGMLSEVAAWTADGRNGRAIAMVPGNPAPRYVTLPGGILDGVDDFTISVWIKYNSIANNARIYDIGNGVLGVANHWMFMTLNGDGLQARSFDSSGIPSRENILLSNAVIPTGVWKHITLTGSGGDRQIYFDGFPAASVAAGPVVAPKDMEPTVSTAWLGKSRFEGAPFNDPALDATMDDFRIYNKVLTPTQVADLAWPQHDYSYWRFDETSGLTAKNSSDNLVSAVLANGVTWTSGRLGAAIDIPGGAPSTTGPQVEFTSSPLASCTTSLTVAVWVKIHANERFARIFDFGTGGGTFIYLAATDGAGMHFAMGKTAIPAFDLVATKPVPDDDAWHHVAVTIDPTGLVKLYIDGVSVVTPSISATLKPSDYAGATESWLGKSRFTLTDSYLNGSIDELRISCRAFTADEIKNLAHPAAP